MTNRIPGLIGLCALLATFGWSQSGVAQTPAASPAKTLFAAEIQVGENWDANKAPNEQAYFAEHSANIKRLREDGSLRLGARYSDKGLLVLLAESRAEAEAMLDQDPSFAAGTFQYQLHPLNAFHWSDKPSN